MLLDRVKEATGATGMGAITLSGTRVAPYQTWASGGAQSGSRYTYLIEDGADSEWGIGTITNTGGTWTFSRDTVFGSIISGASGTTKISLSGNATIACVAPAEVLAGQPATYRGSTWAGAITGTSATLALPAGSAAGDLCICYGAGGNGWSPSTSGFSQIFFSNGWWLVAFYTKTLTAADITTGSISLSIAGSFINYAAISVFAPGAYIASFGWSQLSFNNNANNLPTDPGLAPQVGKVDANPNMLWLLMVSCRAVNTAQTASLFNGTLLSTIGSSTNGNGSGAAWAVNMGNNLPLVTCHHGGTPPQQGLGNMMIGVLGGGP